MNRMRPTGYCLEDGQIVGESGALVSEVAGGPDYVLTLGCGTDDQVWPVTLLDGALSFVRIADAAVANLGSVSSGSSDGLTILFLLAQSIELALKAYLRPCGYDPTKLQKIGHRLSKALCSAVAAGFPRPHPSDAKLLKLLDDIYRERKLQYRGPSAIKVPLLRPVRELAQIYLTEVHRALTCSIADPDKVPGLKIDRAANYGATTLEQLRFGFDRAESQR